MKCPKCEIGKLKLYREIVVATKHKITLSGKIYKNSDSRIVHTTEKDYLECKNMECNQYFNYVVGEDGKIVKESILKR